MQRALALADDARVEGHAQRILAEYRATQRGLLANLDRLVHTNAREALDHDDVPWAVRYDTMLRLDRLNQRLGSYAMWTKALRAVVGEQAHVFDLAAGLCGFGRYLAAHTGWRVTASDLHEDYIAAARALTPGERPKLVVQDALRLADLRDVDVFTCTQALHHFTPGQLVRMFHEATRAAPLGLVAFDLVRGVGTYLGASLLLPVLAGRGVVSHDGRLSVRRSYSAAELTLLARLAGARNVEVRALGPVHLCLRVGSS